MTEKVTIAAFYYSDGDRDDECKAIFERFGGEHFYQETTFVMARVPADQNNHLEREIGYYVPANNADACRTALNQADFGLESVSRQQWAARHVMRPQQGETQ